MASVPNAKETSANGRPTHGKVRRPQSRTGTKPADGDTLSLKISDGTELPVRVRVENDANGRTTVRLHRNSNPKRDLITLVRHPDGRHLPDREILCTFPQVSEALLPGCVEWIMVENSPGTYLIRAVAKGSGTHYYRPSLRGGLLVRDSGKLVSDTSWNSTQAEVLVRELMEQMNNPDAHIKALAEVYGKN